MAVTKAVIVIIARTISVNLSDAGGVWRAEVFALSVSHPIILQGENAGFARAGSPQYCGAGEGEAQHARVGEEIEQPLHIPGMIPGSFDHLGQGEF